MTEPLHVQQARSRMENAISDFVRQSREGDYLKGHALGYEAGRASASVAIPDVPTMLRKVAGWVDAQQLPFDEAHSGEALVRRRLVALLRDLAEHPELNFTAVSRSLGGEQA